MSDLPDFELRPNRPDTPIAATLPDDAARSRPPSRLDSRRVPILPFAPPQQTGTRDEQGDLIGSTGGVIPEMPSEREVSLAARPAPARGLYGGPAAVDTPAWSAIGEPETAGAVADRDVAGFQAGSDALGMALRGLYAPGAFLGPAAATAKSSRRPTAAGPYAAATAVPGLYSSPAGPGAGGISPSLAGAALDATAIGELGRRLNAERQLQATVLPNMPLPGQPPEVQASRLAYLEKLAENEAVGPTPPAPRDYAVTRDAAGLPTIAPIAPITGAAPPVMDARRLGELGRSLTAQAGSPRFIEDPVTGARMLMLPGGGEPIHTGTNPAHAPPKPTPGSELSKLVAERAAARAAGDKETVALYDRAIENYGHRNDLVDQIGAAIAAQWGVKPAVGAPPATLPAPAPAVVPATAPAVSPPATGAPATPPAAAEIPTLTPEQARKLNSGQPFRTTDGRLRYRK